MEINNNTLDNINLRSEDVQEILTTPPHWMIRWGNTLFFAILVIMLIISYIIKYPEFINAPIIISSQNPPEKIEARISSKIEKILIQNQQKVQKGDVLIVLQSIANYQDILALKDIVNSINTNDLVNFPLSKTSQFRLGELQGDYNNFAKALTDEILFKNIKHSAYDLHIRKNINSLYLLEQLKKSIIQWEQNYLIISSTDGIVSFHNFLGINQYISAGENIISIMPNHQEAIIGRMKIPSANSGKIVVGSKVLIKLDNYPYQEFGIIEGKVENISITMDKEGNYDAYIILPKVLKTSYYKEIIFDKEMKGSASIITQDLRLIERFLYQMRKLSGY